MKNAVTRSSAVSCIMAGCSHRGSRVSSSSSIRKWWRGKDPCVDPHRIRVVSYNCAHESGYECGTNVRLRQASALPGADVAGNSAEPGGSTRRKYPSQAGNPRVVGAQTFYCFTWNQGTGAGTASVPSGNRRPCLGIRKRRSTDD